MTQPENRADLVGAPFDPAQILPLLSQWGHGKALGYEYRDHGNNWVEMALPSRPELVGVIEKGILASGAIVSLVDACGGAAVWHSLGTFQPIATIDLRLDYLRPAHEGDTVMARCECYKLTRSVAFVRGAAFIEGDGDLANVAATYILNP